MDFGAPCDGLTGRQAATRLFSFGKWKSVWWPTSMGSAGAKPLGDTSL